jgi:hypothetical protein
MTPERLREIIADEDAELTPEEQLDGWHFCPEMDYDLYRAADPCPLCGFKPGFTIALAEKKEPK